MILFMFNADPRQSAVTLLSSMEQNVLCLIVINGMEAKSREHVGRVTMIPSPSRPRTRLGSVAGKADPARDVDSPPSTPE